MAFLLLNLGLFWVPVKLKPIRASPPKVNLAHMPTIALVIEKLKHLFEEKYMLEPGHFSGQNS